MQGDHRGRESCRENQLNVQKLWQGQWRSTERNCVSQRQPVRRCGGAKDFRYQRVKSFSHTIFAPWGTTEWHLLVAFFKEPLLVFVTQQCKSQDSHGDVVGATVVDTPCQAVLQWSWCCFAVIDYCREPRLWCCLSLTNASIKFQIFSSQIRQRIRQCRQTAQEAGTSHTHTRYFLFWGDQNAVGDSGLERGSETGA